MAAVQDKQPVGAPAVMAPKKMRRNSVPQADLIGGGLLLAALMVLGISLYLGWKASQPSSHPVDTYSLSTPKPAPTVPILKLNQVHQRAGAPITVNPEDIGKQNPFQ